MPEYESAAQRPTFHRCLRERTAKVLYFRGDGTAIVKVLCSRNRRDKVRSMQTNQGRVASSRAMPQLGPCPSRGAPKQGVPLFRTMPQGTALVFLSLFERLP